MSTPVSPAVDAALHRRFSGEGIGLGRPARRTFASDNEPVSDRVCRECFGPVQVEQAGAFRAEILRCVATPRHSGHVAAACGHGGAA